MRKVLAQDWGPLMVLNDQFEAALARLTGDEDPQVSEGCVSMSPVMRAWQM